MYKNKVCLNCEDRHFKCHTTCEKYKKEKLFNKYLLYKKHGDLQERQDYYDFVGEVIENSRKRRRV